MDTQTSNQVDTGMDPVSNGMATTGGVLGILAFILGWIPLIGISIGWVLGILGIIFSSIGMAKSSRLRGVGKGMAVTGLVLAIFTIVLKSIPIINLL